MTKFELKVLLEGVIREMFKRMPSLAGVEITQHTKRTFGQLHPSYEFVLYMEEQKNLIPDVGAVFLRDEFEDL